MYWIKEMQNAITFIEEKLTEDLSIEEISRSANSSSANFQRIFSIVTGITVGDYIRSRRLSLAGKELAESDVKILDTALKYGYETAESFTKAFTRFHDATPSAVKRKESIAKTFEPLLINIDVRGGFIMQRKLIPNVPEIPYDGNNAAFFITLLEATLKGLGEDCDKAMLTALSGEGNRFCWTDGEWVFGNELTDSINETPFETESRVLSAIGWNAKYITVQRGKDGSYMNTDALQIRQDFISTIDRGFPVLMSHIYHADYNLNVYFGYEDDGQKIIGYNYNNGFEAGVSQPFDVSTPITWDNWENNVSRYILLQGKIETASERITALSTFRFIVEHARKTTEIHGKKVGLAAWESYLYHLEHDDFSDLSSEDVKNRFFIYCDGLCQINARKGSLPYYRHLAERFPEWRDKLEKAILALDDCASYGGFLWSQGFTFDEVGFEKFRSLEARKVLADAGREAMQKDMLAVEQFEKIVGLA